MFEQLGLIGCGLMGGSFALALKKAGLVKRVVGYSKSPSTTERARLMGVIDIEAPSALLAVSGADITAPIYTVELLGDATLVTIRSGEALVTVKAPKTFRGAIGEAIGFSVPREAIHLFDAETGIRLDAR